MKKLTYIVLIACAAVFSNCGTTDVWKDWENEGNMSEERLRPSEFKEVLCSVGDWKMTYEGMTFYFQFDEGGFVTSDTDLSILETSVESDYSIDFDGADILLLSMTEGGAMKYLPAGSESTFVITDYSANQITATGRTNGSAMTLVPATAAEIEANNEAKTAAIVARGKEEALDLFAQELNNGVFRNEASAFLAHYLITNDADQWSVKISAIVDGVVKHTEYPLTVDISGDEDAVLSFGNATVGGMSINAFYYNYLDRSIRTNNAGVVLDTRKASQLAAWYNAGDWKTHVLERTDIYAGFQGIHDQVEFDDRAPRNMIACPWNGMGSYVAANSTMKSDDATGRVYLEVGAWYDLFGWNNNPDDYAVVERDYASFWAFCRSTDGFYWSYNDNDGWVYVLSATGEQWFKMKP